MNFPSLLLVAIAAFFAAMGQILLRMTMLKVDAIDVAALANPMTLIQRLLSQPLLLATPGIMSLFTSNA